MAKRFNTLSHGRGGSRAVLDMLAVECVTQPCAPGIRQAHAPGAIRGLSGRREALAIAMIPTASTRRCIWESPPIENMP